MLTENTPAQPPQLLDQVGGSIRYKYYNIEKEQQYIYWILIAVRFDDVPHPHEMAATEVEQSLSWLAKERKAVVATHSNSLRPRPRWRLRAARPHLRYRSRPISPVAIKSPPADLK